MAAGRDRGMENNAGPLAGDADIIPSGIIYDNPGTPPSQTPQQESYGR